MIVLDSRGFRFDQKKQPSSLEISYVISRGKTVEKLYEQTITELWWVPSDRHVSFWVNSIVCNIFISFWEYNFSDFIILISI